MSRKLTVHLGGLRRPGQEGWSKFHAARNEAFWEAARDQPAALYADGSVLMLTFFQVVCTPSECDTVCRSIKVAEAAFSVCFVRASMTMSLEN